MKLLILIACIAYAGISDGVQDPSATEVLIK